MKVYRINFTKTVYGYLDIKADNIESAFNMNGEVINEYDNNSDYEFDKDIVEVVEQK